MINLAPQGRKKLVAFSGIRVVGRRARVAGGRGERRAPQRDAELARVSAGTRTAQTLRDVRAQHAPAVGRGGGARAGAGWRGGEAEPPGWADADRRSGGGDGGARARGGAAGAGAADAVRGAPAGGGGAVQGGGGAGAGD